MKDLYEIETALTKTTAYLESKLQSGQLTTSPDRDLACYYKLPMFFIEIDKPDLARQVIDLICKKFLMTDGDFKTKENLKSIKPEYIEYWTYINGWILRAAQLINVQIPDVALDYFRTYYLGEGAFASHHNQTANGQTTDVLTVAHHGLFYLEQGDHAISNAAANFLYDAFDQQPNLAYQFVLRFDNTRHAISNFDPNQQLFFSVDKNRGAQQLYFMIAYPCAFLVLHYRKTKDEKSLDYAKKYMDFMTSCGEGVLTSRFSHKTAWAASMLYAETGEAEYWDIVYAISEFFAGMQSPEGAWFVEEGDNVSYDQTAEIGCWFAQIIKNINMCQHTMNCHRSY